MQVKIKDLRKGDVTPWYTLLSDPEPATVDGGAGPALAARVEWTDDGGRDLRVWDNPESEVPVISRLASSRLSKRINTPRKTPTPGANAIERSIRKGLGL